MEQLVARQAHNLEVACSSPASATNNDIASCNTTGYVVFRFRLRQICDKDFVLLQIVLQKTEIMNQGKIVFAQIMSLIQKMNSTSA